jgi:hypothetical protein
LLLFPTFAKAHGLSLSIISFPYFLVWLRIINIAITDKLVDEEETESKVVIALVD